MNETIMQTILNKIKEYDTIMLFRHIRIDGDCVGATKGMKRILQLTYPEKSIYLIDDQTSDYLAFMGPDDEQVPDEVYQSALGIVIDTGSSDRISNKKYTLCKELVKIDHHIEREPYGNYNWVEEDRSSACEMIAHFYDTFKDELKIDAQAATYIYTGMVTDSGRFQYEGVTGETMRCAGLMLDQGIDTEKLYAHLYLREYDSLKFKAYIYQTMSITQNGVAYLYITREMQRQFGLTFESASSAIGYLDAIKGCLCWLAFIENPDDDAIRVRLRSRFVAINGIAEKYRGGGHACASGATVYGHKEVQALLDDADALLKEYKATHDGWM